jgi:AcrR family transcriptional regulator
MCAINTQAPRRTQEQRSREMRARLLEATVECLIEEGYKGMTLARVTRRAGTSVGAQQHHFPTKAELVTQAVGYLAEVRIEEIRGAIAELDGPPATKMATALDLTWDTLTGRLNFATRELWTAARTDPALLAALGPAERRTGRALRDLFREELTSPSPTRDALELGIDALRGLALRQVLLGEAETQRQWQRHRRIILRLLEEAVGSESAPPPAPLAPA